MTFGEALEVLEHGYPARDIFEANEKSLEALRILADEERGLFRMKWRLKLRKRKGKDT